MTRAARETTIMHAVATGGAQLMSRRVCRASRKARGGQGETARTGVEGRLAFTKCPPRPDPLDALLLLCRAPPPPASGIRIGREGDRCAMVWLPSARASVMFSMSLQGEPGTQRSSPERLLGWPQAWETGRGVRTGAHPFAQLANSEVRLIPPIFLLLSM